MNFPIPEIFNFYCDISNRIDGRDPGIIEITRAQAAHDRLHQSEKQKMLGRECTQRS
jgi:hypothetical protein